MKLATFTGPGSASHGVICGSVTLAGPDRPVVGAQVVLLRDDTTVARATTDGDGRYLFARVPHGAYQLMVVTPGARRHVVPPAQPVVSASRVARHDVALAPVAVAGKITDHDAPVAGAEVRLAGCDVRTWSSETGEYRLVGVEPGVRTLVVTHGPARRAAPVTLAASSTNTADISLSSP